MLRNALLFATALPIFIGAPGQALAQEEDDLALEAPDAGGDTPKLVVLATTKGKGAPNLKGPVKKLVEKALADSDFEIIPFGKLKKAAKKAKVKPKDLNTADGAKAAAGEAGATHVVVIEAQMDVEKEKKKKKAFFANVQVFAVQSGAEVFNRRWALAGKKLTPAIGEEMVSDITNAVREAAAPEPEPVASAPVEEPPAPPDAPPVVAGAGAGEGAEGTTAPEGEAPAEGTETAGTEGTETAGTEVAPAGEGSTEIAGEMAVPSEGEGTPTAPEGESGAEAVTPRPVVAQAEPAVAETITPEAGKSGRWRPGVHATVGMGFISRQAHINAEVAPQTPPCYCGGSAVFPGAYLAAELYPLAFGGNGSFLEGIGLHVEGFLTSVNTIYNGAGDELSSNVWGMRGGLSYRFVWWESETAPDFRLDLGASYFEFPLRRVSAFPGVKYLTPFYVGGMFEVPLMTTYVALLAGGHVSAVMDPGGKAKRLGSLDSALALAIQGGLRAQYDMTDLIGVTLEGRGMFRYERFSASYSGSTSLELPVQFTNASLTDEIIGGTVSVGIAM